MKQWIDDMAWGRAVEAGLYPPIAVAKKKGFEKLVKKYRFKNTSVLDHGCGTGIFGALLKKRGAKVIGLDISRPLLKVAATRIRAVQGDAHKLPFKDGRFDFVLSLMVLHILTKPERAIREIRRVLKPGGVLLLAIVHPHAGRWDVKKKVLKKDRHYKRIAKRKWVFNLTNGTAFAAQYIHRPLSFWIKALGGFQLRQAYEPVLPSRYPKNKYAKREFLFLVLEKE
jgi:ubiquinone/menaquinone biosynthesis C-methylase UbiE